MLYLDRAHVRENPFIRTGRIMREPAGQRNREIVEISRTFSSASPKTFFGDRSITAFFFIVPKIIPVFYTTQ